MSLAPNDKPVSPSTIAQQNRDEQRREVRELHSPTRVTVSASIQHEASNIQWSAFLAGRN
jgi:hypothetical protein